MQKYRVTFSILILALVLVLVVLHRNSRRVEGVSLQTPSPGFSRTDKISAGPKASAEDSHTENQTPLDSSQRVVASTGGKILLKVYADRTFQLQLPDTTTDIFIVDDEDLFTCWDGIPRGVKIKIRNGAGEIFTADGGVGMRTTYGGSDVSWYRPEPNYIEMPVFSTTRVKPDEPIGPVSDRATDRMSPRGKLADMVLGLSPRLHNQSGLEFKLAILPFALPNARDSNGLGLMPKDFPRHETGWIDGRLLFDDE